MNKKKEKQNKSWKTETVGIDDVTGAVSLIAFSKNGKRFFQNNLEICRQTEKAILVKPIGADQCISTIDMQWWLPISQIRKVEKLTDTDNGCEFYDVEIPMWLFGKIFFD